MAANEQHESFPGLFEALLLVLTLFALETVVAATLYDAGGLLGREVAGLGSLATFFGNALLFTGLMHYKRLSYGALFHGAAAPVGRTAWWLLPPILLLLPGIVLAASAMDALVVWLAPMSTGEVEMFEQMTSGDLVSVVGACVLAPMLEEMLFRGIILRSFLRQYSTRRAIVFSALLFGLAHLNIYQFASASLIGLLFGWLYARTRSLLPCILLHATYNGTLVVLHSVSPHLFDSQSTLSPFWWIAAAVLAFIGRQQLVRAVAWVAEARS